LLFDDVGAPIIARMGWEAEFARAEVMLGKYGFWALALIAVTPIPTQIAMLVAGSLGYPVFFFALAMGVARGARYYGLALLVSLYGDRVVAWIGRRRGAVAEAGYPPR
jgi:membrane protein YqaA with SNARE-associated domain